MKETVEYPPKPIDKLKTLIDLLLNSNNLFKSKGVNAKTPAHNNELNPIC